MEGRFARSLARLHAAGSARLADSLVDHLDAAGAVLVEGLPAFVEREVERVDDLRDAVDRVMTIEVLKASLQPYDRKGSFRLSGQVLHLDGIASDDGYRINFYVVP
ncbi:MULTISPECIES: hypothetical protein [unclassified Pseudomonas]|uniref:hypothetical protein n=1 Tax=unclassified Pseudomonas TaxID=196821 RepID=UPI002447EEF8|nr:MULTISPECIES: hypothetical protein [unclassified Pseudomonas]MDG9928261.1 hypothetical protein [Pseudomonas sp. GD04042]MDH0481175.1 hypothetical protein [Pseudomonas sp. GD04015]MDH0604511.1 hypothetical protein [Pseudomonas sp. GD03869]